MTPAPFRDLADWSAEVFGSLFAHLWYEHFPVGQTGRDGAGRADWTLHVGSTVDRAAWLMGVRCHHESGGRSDAVFKDSDDNDVASVEWEWEYIDSPEVNELDKLLKKEKQRFVALISYCEDPRVGAAVDDVCERWTKDLPLLLVLIHTEGYHRTFLTMTFHCIKAGKVLWTYQQEALPWNVLGTFWMGKTSKAAD